MKAPCKVAPSGPIHLVPDLINGCGRNSPGGLTDYVNTLALTGQRLINPAEFRRDPPPGGVLVMHCSGYGYVTNGAPAVLAEQLAHWRQQGKDRSLLVVFHELYASQPPWRKGFWWGPRQRSVILRLGQISDGCYTTLERYGRWLRRHGIEPAGVLPVPSSVGELRNPIPLNQRDPHLVVFGGGAQRHAAYRALQQCPGLLQSLGLKAIEDIGSPLPAAPLASLPVLSHGRLPADRVSALLAGSSAAAVAYPLDFLAKSSIFAAIASHGCLPLLLPPKRCWAASPTSEDGLAIDRELITPASALHSRAGSASSPVAQAIATSAWQWYQSHRLSEQRRFIQDWLALSLDNTSPCGS